MKRALLMLALLTGCSQELPHRAIWELDPQGQHQNVGPENCLPPRMPYYLELSDGGLIYLECMRGKTSE